MLPKTNRNSTLPNKCKTLAWTNRATNSVQTLPFARLFRLNIRLFWANAGSCCHAHRLAPMQVRISSELIFKVSRVVTAMLD